MLLAGKGISERIFIGNHLPVDIGADWKDMVYVDVNPQNFRGAYSNGSVNIYLYSRPLANFARKNVKALDKMEELLDKAIKSTYDKHYVIQENWRDADYDEKRDFYFNVVNVSITVK